MLGLSRSCTQPFEAAWEEAFAHFRNFTPDDLGRRIVPPRHRTASGFKLGAWQDLQRQNHKKELLAAGRAQRLEDAGIVWEPFLAAWEEGFAHFVEYPPDAEGRRVVPQAFETDGGFKLGWWQHAQRQAWRKRKSQRGGAGGAASERAGAAAERAGAALERAAGGGPHGGGLSAERISRLEAAGIVWDPQEAAWEEGFAYFRRCQRRPISKTYVTENGYHLGTWVKNQRAQRKRGELGKKRTKRLEAAGIVWDPMVNAWDEGYSRFVDFPDDAFGKRVVPRSYVTEDGFHLGAWQTNQRTAYRKGQLSEQRASKLAEAGIVWNAKLPPGEDDGDQFEATCDLKSRRRSRLRALLSGAPASREAAAPTEAAWHDEWRRRFGCWWLALAAPTRAELTHCLGALSLHLGSQLERVRGGGGGRGGRGTGNAPTRAPAPVSQTQCEWLQTASERLTLPELPEIGGFDFSLPPLPRLVPPLQELRASYGQRARPAAAREGWPPMALAVSGAGGIAFVVAGLRFVLCVSRKIRITCM